MGGGIMQVIRSSKENYITGNPQMTFFKSVYRRHTNFAMETMEVPMNSTPTSDESTVTATVPKNAGDLLGYMFYDILLTAVDNINLNDNESDRVMWTPSTGYAILKETSIIIGSQVIETIVSEWNDIWNELTDIDNKEHFLVNKVLDNQIQHEYADIITGKQGPSLQMYVPIKFFFCKNTGLHIPLISLQYDEVQIKTTFRKSNFLMNCQNKENIVDNTNNPEIKLFANYIYLDTDERRQFAQKPQEYLIEQVQHNGKKSLSDGLHELNFNHLVKEIVWVCKKTSVEEADITTKDTNIIDNYPNNSNERTANNPFHGNDYFNYTVPTDTASNELPDNIQYIRSDTISREPFKTAKLILDGNDRTEEFKASYFRTLQPYFHHSKVPQKFIYCYSFALYPEKYQPMGFCDFSKYKNVSLSLTNTMSDANLLVFSLGYNILRIKEGKAGLAYLI